MMQKHAQQGQATALPEIEEMRLVAFFQTLMKIDQRARITPTTKSRHKKGKQ